MISVFAQQKEARADTSGAIKNRTNKFHINALLKQIKNKSREKYFGIVQVMIIDHT